MSTHWKKLVNPNYLGVYSLDKGQDKTLTIKEVKREVVVSTGGKKEECTVAYFKENEKPMILNRTNCKTITKIHNTPYIEEWANKQITVFATVTRLAGDDVECLRIRTEIPKLPTLDKTHDKYNAVVEALKNKTATIAQVKARYTIDENLEKELSSL